MKRMTISKDDISEVYVEGIKIYLKLKDKRKKHIVTADVLNKCFIMRRKFNGHLLKALNAYGFNYALCKYATERNIITHVNLKIYDLGIRYWVPIKDILEFGEFQQHKKDGNKLQKFMNLSKLEKYKAY